MADAAQVSQPGTEAVGVPAVRLDGVTKRFGEIVAVDDVTLDVRPGEFFSMLGPSGPARRPASA